MDDLTQQKSDGICGKANEVERQLRDRLLKVCCEDQMAKLPRQEGRQKMSRDGNDGSTRVTKKK